MGKLEKMYKLIEDENIFLDITDKLPDDVDGIYIKKPGYNPVIGINKKIENNSKKFNIVLAEELGHHFTSTGNSSAMFNSYSERISLNRAENKAMRWATEFLLPFPDIDEAFTRYENYGIEEILDKLEVDRDFFIKRLEFIAKYKLFVDLSNGTILSLASLPNVFVMKKL